MTDSEKVKFSLNKDDWSSHARKYAGTRTGDSLSRPMLIAAFNEHFFELIDDRIKQSNQPVKILCLCGGPGPEAKIICERYDQTQIDILTTDNAEGMVDVAKEEIEKANYGDRAKARVMDAMNIDEANESYDIVTLILGPMLLPDPQKCFEEVARILKPQGLFFTLTPSKMDVHEVFHQCKVNVLKASDPNADLSNIFLEQLVTNWGTPEALKEKLNKSNVFQHVDTRIHQSFNPAATPEDVDEILDLIFANPGMSKLYTGTFTAQQTSEWKKAVREEFYHRQRAVEQYGMKMNCCSGSAVKR